IWLTGNTSCRSAANGRNNLKTLEEAEQQMVGTWEIEVTERNHARGSSLKKLRAVNAFTREGAVVELGARDSANLGRPGSVHH
ncbi:MAG: hypothetical protein ACREO9_05040, partial [Lysobacterales bacterium]